MNVCASRRKREGEKEMKCVCVCVCEREREREESEADSTFGGDDSRHQLSSSFGRTAFNSTHDLERRVKKTKQN